MKHTFSFGSSVASFFVSCLLISSGSWADSAEVPASPSPARIGRQIPNFVLEDAQGKQVGLADFHNSPVVVVLFLGTECPIGNQYVPHLKELRNRFASAGVTFLIINSNTGDTLEKIREHQSAYKLDFPLFFDPRQEVADIFSAERMTQCFVLDYRRIVRYAGRIDDRIGYGAKKPKPTREDLAEAIQQVLKQEPVSTPETTVAGCLITRRESPETASLTYSKDIAPILQKKCENCHHTGTAAPFTLSSYEDAANWSAMIREVVVDRRMPPWHADPRFGKFGNCRTLTSQEIESLVAWIDNGTPEGNKADLPQPIAYTEGWQIEQPDVIFKLPEQVKVPAEGVVRYKYFETKTDFKEDVWIEAAEARPGNRAVVHHIIVFYNDPNSRGDLDDGWIVAYAPGDSPLQLAGRQARRIPKGATLIWQMHYTPTGKEEVDQSELALRFYKGKEPPEHNVKTRGLYNRRFSIPAENPHYRVASTRQFDKETTILTLMPHLHLRGKSFEYKFIYPDGREEIALSVPQYDFNWQTSYQFEKPLVVPAGTRMECTAYFDNSPSNPANPDPKKTVRWGEQTWDEMMIGYMEYYDADSDAEGKLADAPAPLKTDGTEVSATSR